MDFTSIRDQVSNLSLYDLKAGVRKVQNGMLTTKDRETASGAIVTGRGVLTHLRQPS